MGDADHMLVTRLEDIAWLYNLGGRDIENTPVFYGFALISKERDVLYVMDGRYAVSYTHLGKGITQYITCSFPFHGLLFVIEYALIKL